MEEIARCFEEVGLPGATFEGFAEVYRRVTAAHDALRSTGLTDDTAPAEVLDRVADTARQHRDEELVNQGVRS
jgi:hypothetical protein